MRSFALDQSGRRRVFLTLLVAGCYLLLCWQPRWMMLFGFDFSHLWFLDTHALLAASDAHALGIDPAARNPLDFFHQPHVYSDWWFGLHALGLTRADYVWLGALLGFLFLIAALLHFGTRSHSELLFSLSMVAAPPIVLGFQRGNADLLIFMILAITVPLISSRHVFLRWLSLVPILAATGLKFYPALAALLLLAPTRSRREILGQLAVFAVLLGWLISAKASDLHRYVIVPERPSGFYTFGAPVISQLLAIPMGAAELLPWIFAGAAVIFWWRIAPSSSVPLERQTDYLRFILGATLLVGCYLLTTNYAYRLVFALFMTTFTWWMWHAPNWPRWYRLIGRVTAVLVVVSLWADGLFCLSLNLAHISQPEVDRWTTRLILAEQPLLAMMIFGLLGFLVPFTRDALRRLATPAPAPPAVRVEQPLWPTTDQITF